MDAELTHHLGVRGMSDWQEGAITAMAVSAEILHKGIGEVGVKVPRDRNGAFQTQYAQEQAIRGADRRGSVCNVSDWDKHEDAFLLSKRLIGRSISTKR